MPLGRVNVFQRVDKASFVTSWGTHWCCLSSWVCHNDCDSPSPILILPNMEYLFLFLEALWFSAFTFHYSSLYCCFVLGRKRGVNFCCCFWNEFEWFDFMLNKNTELHFVGFFFFFTWQQWLHSEMTSCHCERVCIKFYICILAEYSSLGKCEMEKSN